MYRQTIEKYPMDDPYYEGEDLEEMELLDEDQELEEIPIEPLPQVAPISTPCSCKDKVYQQASRPWMIDAAITAGTVLVFVFLIKMILK